MGPKSNALQTYNRYFESIKRVFYTVLKTHVNKIANDILSI